MKVIVSPPQAFIHTHDPKKLLATIKSRIRQKDVHGKIKTWEYDSEGDFRYLAQQYEDKAWIRPEIDEGIVNLKLVWPENKEPSQEIKGIFIGRLTEMILGHIDDSDFMRVRAIPLTKLSCGDVTNICALISHGR